MARIMASEEVRQFWGATLDGAIAGEEEVIIHRHGRSVAVLMGYEQWRKLIDEGAHPKLTNAANQHSAEMKGGVYLTKQELLLLFE